MNRNSQGVNIVFHLICYYIAWFSCIILAAKDMPWLSFTIIILITAIQIIWQAVFHNIKYVFYFILMLTLAGFIIDTGLLQLGLLSLKANPYPLLLSPPWMVGLWINFSVLFYAVLYNYYQKYILLAILAFIGFPLAYLAGEKLGAAQLLQGWISMLSIGIVWGLLFPSLCYLFVQRYWSRCHD